MPIEVKVIRDGLRIYENGKLVTGTSRGNVQAVRDSTHIFVLTTSERVKKYESAFDLYGSTGAIGH